MIRHDLATIIEQADAVEQIRAMLLRSAVEWTDRHGAPRAMQEIKVTVSRDGYLAELRSLKKLILTSLAGTPAEPILREIFRTRPLPGACDHITEVIRVALDGGIPAWPHPSRRQLALRRELEVLLRGSP